MDGYSEPGAIYFSIGKKTAYAKIDLDEIFYANEDLAPIKTGSYLGTPPYRTINGELSRLAKEFHAAEHKVYNCFQEKIKNLKANSSLKIIRKFIPKLDEIEKAKPFSMFCGTTIFLSSGLLLLVSALPNIFLFLNKNLVFMIAWLSFSIFITLVITTKIQQKYFLLKPKTYQIKVALEALKEALKDEHINNEFSSSIRILPKKPCTTSSSHKSDLGLQDA